MGSYIRNYVEGGTFFFTLVTKDRIPFFNNDDNCEIFISAVEKVRKYRPFDLDAQCILPDHIHLIITLPENEHNYSNIIREIKKNVTKNIRLHLNNPQTVIWQDRFWEHTIRNQRDLQTHYVYTIYNAVKHGFVDDVGDWKWSSFCQDDSPEPNQNILKHIEKIQKDGYSFGE